VNLRKDHYRAKTFVLFTDTSSARWRTCTPRFVLYCIGAIRGRRSLRETVADTPRKYRRNTRSKTDDFAVLAASHQVFISWRFRRFRVPIESNDTANVWPYCKIRWSRRSNYLRGTDRFKELLGWFSSRRIDGEKLTAFNVTARIKTKF